MNRLKIYSILVILILLISMTGCNKQESNQSEFSEKPMMRVAALKGPTGMGMVKLMERNENGTSALAYQFTVLGSPDELVGKIINGEVDVAAVPTNMALLLYNRTEGAVQLAAVNTLGVLYLLENGYTINSIGDLKGRRVSTSGKGASPDFIFRYILNQNNLEEDKDVVLDYKLQHTELAAALVAGDVKIALLPQPHVTTALMRNQDLRIALDITEEWNKATGGKGKLIMGVLIVQKDFAEKNSKTLNVFLDEYKDSVEFVNNNIEVSSELMEKYDILPNKEIAQRAIPYSGIVYIDAYEAKPFLEELFGILFGFDPRSIGGKLADEGFYYNR